jgi:biotin-dependent carboxylase-like uncharacterized protein
MHLGVPPSGALDIEALALANRLVGNPESAAGLEVLLGGVRLESQTSTRVALTGARAVLRIGGRAASWGVAESVRPGETIEIEPAPDELRSWLAVAGGLDVPEVLGSRSTDTLTGLGPPTVAAGDRLAVGSAGGAPEEDAAGVPQGRPEVWSLPVEPGPRADWFTAASSERLVDQEYVVSASSNRTALRLDADTPLERSVDEELVSEGIVTGAVQVPASGRPLVFLADHPVTGGYPVVGVVTSTGLAACAQARPGDRLRFQRALHGHHVVG